MIGTLLNSRGMDVSNKKMDDLESVTTRANGSVITGNHNDIVNSNLETIKENTRHKIINDKINRGRNPITKAKRTMNLPIYSYENELLQEIENNQVILINMLILIFKLLTFHDTLLKLLCCYITVLYTLKIYCCMI